MTTQEFLNRYDNKELFSETELQDIYWGDFDGYVHEVDNGTGELYRWNHLEYKILQIGERYFDVARMAGNTEYQENEYDIQPQEVKRVERMVIDWEAITQ